MASDDERKLFVAGLSDSMAEDALREAFERLGGTVVDVSVPRDRATGRSRGFGFVTLGTADQAASAREALDGTVHGGAQLSVRAFKAEPPRRGEAGGRPPERSRGGGDRTLYVGNLPYDCSQEQLQELFEANDIGPILRIHLPVGQDGRARGYGFVTMGSAEAATAAIEGLRGAELQGRKLQVSVAHPRGERGDRGAPSERPDRGPSPRPSGRPSGPPPGAEPRAASSWDGGPEPDAPWDAPARAEGRRRVTKPERAEKKKRGRGRAERQGDERRARDSRKQKNWEDWDED
jgi:RNA recognition motif-containing protein